MMLFHCFMVLFLTCLGVALANDDGKALSNQVEPEPFICPTDKTCLIELNGDDFHAFVDMHLISCIVFYQDDQDYWSGKYGVKKVFEELAVITENERQIGVAAMKIGANPKIAQSVAATGPFSVKLFDRRLKISNYYDIYALHLQGNHFKQDAASLVRLLGDYVQNSTGIAELDQLTADFAHQYGQGGMGEVRSILRKVKLLVESIGTPRAHAYAEIMQHVADTDLYTIAHSYNDISLQISEARKPAEGAKHATLNTRTNLLLRLHVTSQLAKMFLEDEDDLPLKTPQVPEAGFQPHTQTPKINQRSSVQKVHTSKQAETSLQ